MSSATVPRRTLLRLSRFLLPLLAVALAGLLAVVLVVRGSLATTDGELTVPGLAAPVNIERDAQGIPTIASDDRRAIAYGLGFLHAQERFFQMDLLRRNAAGELAELVGEVGLAHDRRIRAHRFRARARRNLGAMPVPHLALITAYADGVSAGLAQLKNKPFEYYLLGVEPVPWQSEDCLLVLFSMYVTLQDEFGETERYDSLLAEVLPGDLYAFLQPGGGRWDAPLLGEAFAPAALPGSGIADVLTGEQLVYQALSAGDDRSIGSNNWAVGGVLTPHGGATVANDMHLDIRVPNIWYRARWPLGDGLVMTGVTLPGTPVMVVGSNGRVAWGFTNACGDWSDLVVLETDASQSRYRAREEWIPFERHEETLRVKGGKPETLVVRDTRWGPVIGQDHRGRLLALRWVAHDPEGASLNILDMEQTTTTAAALVAASSFGQPAQNFVAGDDRGNIGWTVAGPIPRRRGLDGNRPRSWADGTVGWDGYLDHTEAPRVYNPESHRLWTANARTVDGDDLRLLGDGGYSLGARQQQIRDALFAKDSFSERDLLGIQLDDRAVFLGRWHGHLLSLLGESRDVDVPLAQPREAVVKELHAWGARAGVDSVGYRLVRNFRLKVIEYAMAPFVTAALQVDERFDARFVQRSVEYPVWAMIEQQPAHLLNPDFATWRALQLAALNAVLKAMAADGRPLAEQTWGLQNVADIRHPLAGALPMLQTLLSMPAEPLSGDSHMPRVQGPSTGASERMVVSPGREDEGIFHMATGQSGHPWSRWFNDGHRDWVEGRASDFLPGEARHRLRLLPE